MAEGDKYCPNCGQPVGAGPVPQSTPPPQYYAPPRQSPLPVILIIIIVVVVAAVALASIGFFFLVNEQNRGGVGLTVNDVSPYAGNVTVEGEWIVLNVTLTNDRDYSLPISQVFFTLVAGGDSVGPELTVDDEYPVPDSVAPGENATFSLVFEVPEGAEPERLVFNNIISEASAPVT